MPYGIGVSPYAEDQLAAMNDPNNPRNPSYAAFQLQAGNLQQQQLQNKLLGLQGTQLQTQNTARSGAWNAIQNFLGSSLFAPQRSGGGVQRPRPGRPGTPGAFNFQAALTPPNIAGYQDTITQLLNRQQPEWQGPDLADRYGNLGPIGTPNLAGRPTITAGPIFSDDQIAQAVNAIHAGTQANTAQRGRAASNQLSARGYGADSPLLQALQAQYGAQGLQAGVQGEREFRLGTSERNAQHVLDSQRAQESQYGTAMQEMLRDREIQSALQQAKLQAALNEQEGFRNFQLGSQRNQNELALGQGNLALGQLNSQNSLAQALLGSLTGLIR